MHRCGKYRKIVAEGVTATKTVEQVEKQAEVAEKKQDEAAVRAAQLKLFRAWNQFS